MKTLSQPTGARALHRVKPHYYLFSSLMNVLQAAKQSEGKKQLLNTELGNLQSSFRACAHSLETFQAEFII